ncbi:hypothetical protein GCM10010310_37000 [Streptomyces violaceolatus]|uniref:Uncharacterized protein n=1 Tax=Streptomyces violaceolatus TaxID=67378 RepID=A0ABN3STA0_9ACTN
MDNFRRLSAQPGMLALAGGFAADGGPAHGHRETYGGPGMHPMVKPALRRGWRDLNTVQFGMTPGRTR